MKRASSLATTTTTPPLLAEEWTLRTAPRVAWDATLRIQPGRPPATITRAAPWAQKHPPRSVTSRTRCRAGHGPRHIGHGRGPAERDEQGDPGGHEGRDEHRHRDAHTGNDLRQAVHHRRDDRHADRHAPVEPRASDQVDRYEDRDQRATH